MVWPVMQLVQERLGTDIYGECCISGQHEHSENRLVECNDANESMCAQQNFAYDVECTHERCNQVEHTMWPIE